MRAPCSTPSVPAEIAAPCSLGVESVPAGLDADEANAVDPDEAGEDPYGVRATADAGGDEVGHSSDPVDDLQLAPLLR